MAGKSIVASALVKADLSELTGTPLTRLVGRKGNTPASVSGVAGGCVAAVSVDAVAEPVEQHGNGALIHVWAVPRSSRTALDGLHGGRVKVRVAAPPEGGAANKVIAQILSESLAAPVELVRGERSRAKAFLVVGVDTATARSRLGV